LNDKLSSRLSVGKTTTKEAVDMIVSTVCETKRSKQKSCHVWHTLLAGPVAESIQYWGRQWTRSKTITAGYPVLKLGWKYKSSMVSVVVKSELKSVQYR